MSDQPLADHPSDAAREAADLDDEIREMERSDRAIPLPEQDEDEEGVGPVSGVVP